MPLGIVIGIPIGVKDRLAAAIKKQSWLPNWEFLWIPSRGRAFETNPELIVKTLSNIGNAAPHILAFKPPAPSQREWILKNILPFFRFKWLENGFGMPDLEETVPKLMIYLEETLKKEEWWDENLKPIDLSSPLLLPQISFSCHPELQDIWELAKRTEEPGQAAFGKKIASFNACHLKKNAKGKIWLDRKSHAYDWHGPKHGYNIPFPRYWKMSFRVPDGFHYDVQSLSKSKCELQCSSGKWYKEEYLNVDVHGYIRAPSNK